jgi:hypothetical protein
MNIHVSEDLYRKAAQIAEGEHLTVDQVFESAFVEHLGLVERLKRRAANGDHQRFLAVLDKAPNVEPEESDRL